MRGLIITVGITTLAVLISPLLSETAANILFQIDRDIWAEYVKARLLIREFL